MHNCVLFCYANFIVRKYNFKKIAKKIKFSSNKKYLTKHPEFEHFSFPKTFYFKYCPYSLELHWAIIKEYENYKPLAFSEAFFLLLLII